MVVERFVYSLFNYLTRLLPRENFIEFGRRESFRLYYILSSPYRGPSNEESVHLIFKRIVIQFDIGKLTEPG